MKLRFIGHFKVVVPLVMVLFTSFSLMGQGYEYVLLGKLLSIFPNLTTDQKEMSIFR